jgi:acyl-CoA dehydrogenase
LRNLPNRWAAAFLRVFIFPRGRTYSAPSDEIAGKVVELMTSTGEARERLSEQAYTTLEPGNPLGLLQEALELSEVVAPLERRLRQALKEGLIHSEYLGDQIGEAEHAGVVNKREASELRNYHEKVASLLAVDDFAPGDLIRTANDTTAAPIAAPVKKTTAAKKAATGKKATGKTATSKKKTSKKKFRKKKASQK